jgi:large subunit ribosomal protein L29
MAFPKIAEARNLSDSELAGEILAAKKKLVELRLLQATRRLEKPHEFKHTRHRLAQLMSVEAERRRAQARTTQSPSVAEAEE